MSDYRRLMTLIQTYGEIIAEQDAKLDAAERALEKASYMETELREEVATLTRAEDNRIEELGYARAEYRGDRNTWEDQRRAFEQAIARLQEELQVAKFGIPSDQDSRAVAYMETKGRAMWAMGVEGYPKIEMIKDVRTITGWGLKVAKDYVEGYDWAANKKA